MKSGENPQPSEQSPVRESMSDYKKRLKRTVATFLAAGVLTWGVKTNFDLKRGTVKPSFQEFLERSVSEHDNLSQKEFAALHANLSYLSEQYSPLILQHLSRAAHRGATDMDKLPEEPSLSLRQSQSDILELEQMRKLWSEENYPLGSINRKVALISVVEESLSKPSAYGHEIRTEHGRTTSETNEIHLSVGEDPIVPLENNLIGVDWVFSHELGHINDWEHDPSLDLAERAAFLADVTRAFNTAGSFRDSGGYIDGIKNPDVNVERYSKVSEYWAELTRYYLSYPAHFKNMASPIEVAIVEGRLKKGDPLFDAEKAQARRLKIIQEIASEKSVP